MSPLETVIYTDHTPRTVTLELRGATDRNARREAARTVAALESDPAWTFIRTPQDLARFFGA